MQPQTMGDPICTCIYIDKVSSLTYVYIHALCFLCACTLIIIHKVLPVEGVAVDSVKSSGLSLDLSQSN